MSRSIGDRYLKPWIIPDPEVMVIPRARDDECLIIATDGLWDVMTNDEACEVARRQILLRHKKNDVASLSETGNGIDPGAQAAADYLSSLALRKGSKDNISVIVVDLKAQRKFDASQEKAPAQCREKEKAPAQCMEEGPDLFTSNQSLTFQNPLIRMDHGQADFVAMKDVQMGN